MSKMNKNAPLVITPCANGFIIEQRSCIAFNELIVFVDLPDLLDFLEHHFTDPLHYCECYREDKT